MPGSSLDRFRVTHGRRAVSERPPRPSAHPSPAALSEISPFPTSLQVTQLQRLGPVLCRVFLREMGGALAAAAQHASPGWSVAGALGALSPAGLRSLGLALNPWLLEGGQVEELARFSGLTRLQVLWEGAGGRSAGIGFVSEHGAWLRGCHAAPNWGSTPA